MKKSARQELLETFAQSFSRSEICQGTCEACNFPNQNKPTQIVLTTNGSFLLLCKVCFAEFSIYVQKVKGQQDAEYSTKRS